jgi:hypothetical protein
MKRHLAELKTENAQQTPVLVGGKRSRHFSGGTPVVGLTDCQDERQVCLECVCEPGSGGGSSRQATTFVMPTLCALPPPWPWLRVLSRLRPPQADTPDSVRPAAVAPGTTERLLAGFTLNTPIAGLKLQVRPRQQRQGRPSTTWVTMKQWAR